MALVLFASGCQRPIPPEGPTVAVVEERSEVNPLWDSTIAVLRKCDFRIDRQDRSQGVITTQPVTSMQWFEFWRQDVAHPYDYLQASLDTIERKVTVKFRNGNNWTIDVQVDVYRMNSPDVQITTASSAVHALSGLLPTTEGQVYPHAREGEQWVPMGRDGNMEARLMQRILSDAGLSEWVEQQG